MNRRDALKYFTLVPAGYLAKKITDITDLDILKNQNHDMRNQLHYLGFKLEMNVGEMHRAIREASL